MSNKITVRPCKEHPTKWEIQEPNGQVLSKHFNTKEECVSQARKMAYEYGCELTILNQNPNSNSKSNT